jgi:imidazolonepropionase-like amidohydrolase
MRGTVRIFWAAICLLVSPQILAQWLHPSSAPLPDTIIQGGWLFDGFSDQRQANPGILIRAGKIAELGVNPADFPLATTRFIVLDKAKTVLPGMFDLHAHYNLDLIDEGRVEEVIYNGTLFLANGVTTTWSAGEYYPERVIAQRDRIDAGEAVGPRLFASGPYFGAFRCEYSVKVAADECIGWPNDITETEIRNEVDVWQRAGVSSIKIKQATPEEMRILIDQAHKHGMTTASHLANYNVEYDVDLQAAILMGLDRVEHQLTLGSGGERSAELPEVIDLMLEHGVYYDANLQMYGGINERRAHSGDMLWTNEAQYFTPYTQRLLKERGDPPPESDAEEYAQRVLELKLLYEAGGRDLLVVGTDEPVYTLLLPGFAYHRELWAMHHAGLPNAVVLQAATLNGARALGVDDRLGSIEAGKQADLIVVQGNPLQDIKAARHVNRVFKSGVEYDPQALLKSAKGKIGPNGPDDHADWVLHYRALRGDDLSQE